MELHVFNPYQRTFRNLDLGYCALYMSIEFDLFINCVYLRRSESTEFNYKLIYNNLLTSQYVVTQMIIYMYF